jgi:hypothetical protein
MDGANGWPKYFSIVAGLKKIGRGGESHEHDARENPGKSAGSQAAMVADIRLDLKLSVPT